MSGIASAAATSPGSVATFGSCSKERSAAISPSSSRSAKSRAGTRIPALLVLGSSNSTGESSRISAFPLTAALDIEHHPCPRSVRLLHVDEVMQRRPLYQGQRLAIDKPNLPRQGAVAQLNGCAGWNHPFPLCQEDQLLDEIDQQPVPPPRTVRPPPAPPAPPPPRRCAPKTGSWAGALLLIRLGPTST